MRILLDTCAFLWLVTDDPRLNETAKDVFLDAGNELLLSAVTGFEVTVKHDLGKLQLAEPPRSFIANRLRANAADGTAHYPESCDGIAGFALAPQRPVRPAIGRPSHHGKPAVAQFRRTAFGLPDRTDLGLSRY